MAINGAALATLGVGVAFAWGGLTNRSPLQALRFAVAGTAPTDVPQPSGASMPSPASVPSGSSATGKAQIAISYAEAQVGKPYKFGTAGPDTFDCSGLVMRAWGAAGISLPHYTGAMILLGTKIAKTALQPGDLVFPDYHHVQLYVGDGQICEAADVGIPVRVVPMWGFYTARRVYNGN